MRFKRFFFFVSNYSSSFSSSDFRSSAPITSLLWPSIPVNSLYWPLLFTRKSALESRLRTITTCSGVLRLFMVVSNSFLFSKVQNYVSAWNIFRVIKNNTTPRFSSLVFDNLYALLCFSGTWVDKWLIFNKNIIFALSPLHSCLPFVFVFIRLLSWKSWNFRIVL